MKKRTTELNVNEVHIWNAYLLESENNIDFFYSILSLDEHNRASRFKFFRDKRRFVITRGILRCLLSFYLRQAPESIEIVYGLWGKPYLRGKKRLCFNVSHSRNYALYAVTRSYEVGIDLEYIDNNLKLEDMAPHIFSKIELMNWQILDLEERTNIFFKRWVSQEAFLKALGKGWFEDKKKLIFNAQNTLKEEDLNNDLINLYHFECIPGYASALFVDGESLHPVHYSWNRDRAGITE